MVESATFNADGVTSRELANADEYVATLKDEFDLDLPEAATLWPRILQQHELYLREKEKRRQAKQAQKKQSQAGG